MTEPRKPRRALAVILYIFGALVLAFIALNVYVAWIVSDAVDDALSDPHNGEAIERGVGEFLQALGNAK